MDNLVKEKILIISPGSVEAVRKEYDLDGSGRMEEAVNILREWIQHQPHILKKDFTSNYLESIIIMSKGSLEKAKKTIDKRCTYRTLMPTFFGVHDTRVIYEQYLKGNVEAAVLPKQSSDFHRFFVARVYGNKYFRENLMNFYRFCVYMADYVLNFSCTNGLIVIYDLTQTSVTELLASFNFLDFKNILTVFIEGYAMKVKEIHVITKSSAVETVISIVKPWLGKKIGNRISVFNSPEELSTIYPPDLLPTEYGGTEDTMHNLFENWINELSTDENKERIKDMDRAATDESLRADDFNFNEEYAGIAGTFRYLTVD